MVTAKQLEPSRETPGFSDYEADLINELGRRLASLWGYDRYILNARGLPAVREFWRGAKAQEQRNIDQIKKLIGQHVQSDGDPSHRQSQ